MTYQERFKAIIVRIRSDKDRYESISIMPKNPDEECVWKICSKFWGENHSADEFNITDNLDPDYANGKLNELEKLLDKMGWKK